MKVKIAAIVEALELSSDEATNYLDRESGKVLFVTEEAMMMVEEPDEEVDADGPDWMKDDLEDAQLVAANPDRFILLPNKFEIDEWKMMEKFAYEVETPEISRQVLDAIHSKGAFRKFKDMMEQLGLLERWYAYRGERYLELARDWCESEKFDYE